jgi:hypothetical protein
MRLPVITHYGGDTVNDVCVGYECALPSFEEQLDTLMSVVDIILMEAAIGQ